MLVLTISSMRSLIASSNCSGWLEAYTTMKRSVCSPVRYRKAFSAFRMSSLIVWKDGWRRDFDPIRTKATAYWLAGGRGTRVLGTSRPRRTNTKGL